MVDSIAPDTTTASDLIKQAAQAQNEKAQEKVGAQAESQRADSAALQLGVGEKLDISV